MGFFSGYPQSIHLQGGVVSECIKVSEQLRGNRLYTVLLFHLI